MSIEFRALASTEIGDALRLWEACGLIRPWNDPEADARRALEGPTSTILTAFAATNLIGPAMCGWDGHRGSIYYLGVDHDFRRWGIGRKLMWHCEDWLGQFEAPMIQLMVRTDDKISGRFCDAISYDEDSYRLFYRPITAKCHREQ